MIKELATIKRVLKREQHSNLAFVFGNGINRYAYNNATASWEDMLLYLWAQESRKTLSTISEGVSYTEFYNILELEGFSIDKLREEVVAFTEKRYQPAEYHQWLSDRLMERDVPVLTTNFDRNLERYCKPYMMYKNEGMKRGFTDYYPWNVYYSNRKLHTPLDGYGIWHINGMTKYKRSIKLGLSEYINQTARARGFIHSDDKIMDFDKKNRPYWNGSNTWLHIIFNSSLCFCGLGLDINETFLRWMLLERARYFNKFPDRKKKGWYVCCDKQEEGKRFFLESTGIEIVMLKNYKEVYEGLFE